MSETQVKCFSLDELLSTGDGVKYSVPLYQREYAWGEVEIHQLLDDLWEAYSQNKEQNKGRNYHLGTIVVFWEQKANSFELVDGQQRLTTLSLLYKLLVPAVNKCHVGFLNRDASERFLSAFFHSDNPWNFTPPENTPNAFCEALSALRDYRYISGDAVQKGKSEAFFDLLGSTEDAGSFRNYILKHLMLFRVQMPNNTDVSSYFEVINNRGKQLEPHEQVKALIIAKLYCQGRSRAKSDKLAERFNAFWTACSSMDGHLVQYLHGCVDIEKDESVSWTRESVSYDLSSVDTSVHNEYRSVIDDFPNFLMHVLRIYLRDIKGLSEDEVLTKISLDDRKLMPIFNAQLVNIDPIQFLDCLIRTRLKFDRFVVKSEHGEDGAVEKWTLSHFIRHNVKRNVSYYAVDTYGGKEEKDVRDRLIRIESMLQVTYRTRRYKDWLYKLLSDKTIDFANPHSVLAYLENYTRRRVLLALPLENENRFHLGCATPHVVFNVLDYLLWRCAARDNAFDKYPLGSSESNASKEYVDNHFVFAYRSSVEHHHPRHQFSDDGKSGIWNDDKDINDIGNLCLVYSTENSSLNNRTPKSKADHQRQNARAVPPKQRWMYKMTIIEGSWKKSTMADQSKVEQGLIDNFAKVMERAHALVTAIVTDARCALAPESRDFSRFDLRGRDENGGCELVLPGRTEFRHGLHLHLGFEYDDYQNFFVGVFCRNDRQRNAIYKIAQRLAVEIGMGNNCNEYWPLWVNADTGDLHWTDEYLSEEKKFDERVTALSAKVRIVVNFICKLESKLDEILH